MRAPHGLRIRNMENPRASPRGGFSRFIYMRCPPPFPPFASFLASRLDAQVALHGKFGDAEILDSRGTIAGDLRYHHVLAHAGVRASNAAPAFVCPELTGLIGVNVRSEFAVPCSVGAT